VRSIYLKELSSFFSSLTGYMVLVIFLLITGLFAWVFSNTSIPSYNYASIGQLFVIAPMVLLFLIPALTMQTFAQEKQQRTMEFLNTKPLTDTQIVLGKYFACMTLVALAILPTLIYYYSVYQLGSPKGNIDSGATIGSYIGLFLLASVFVSIGLFMSSLTDNQIVAFILTAFSCFLVYFAFSFIGDLPSLFGKWDDLVKYFGIEYHYDNISKGRIDTRDVIYFVSLASMFIWLTMVSLSRRGW
jgi:ABC-2 type transport system permease protein